MLFFYRFLAIVAPDFCSPNPKEGAMDTMTYRSSGVNYDAMDPFKRAAQLAARETAPVIGRLNNGEFKEFEPSRGESAYLIEAAKSYFAHVEEGLGTKNLVADAMYQLTGKSYYDHIAQDTVAMIVNDMITVGALPLSVAMHLAVGDSAWFKDEQRSQDLIDGWQRACILAGAVWGGGETPTLKDIVMPGTVVLSGSAMGLVKPKERLLTGDRIKHNDAIILVESSGIHANGLTMARKIADKLPEGYLTTLSGGRTYGETLLDPTLIYVRFIEECFNKGVDLHYVVNITGHGWRKLMRAPGNFAYIVEHLPRPKPIFDFIQEHGPVDDREAFGNLNMGAGLALYLPHDDVKKVFGVLVGGWAGAVYPHIETTCIYAGIIEASDRRRVVIKLKNLEYVGEELNIR
ncbi:phosphoribosylformylglycinamidine cyclo-ligase [Candidatus Kaiserbacteria bacterium]|nr:phosphoribosylformylglycinamidine cyclo-ligase [Candidatus Kaiserbacteria bacterium]